ncbi:phosphomannomutase/phosphoglucomutase [Vagococcus vulneris]|uniref:Phosphomannomutase/phosphoglucomutase n=1 Tax=Vagococcus vulneris TaxID=1977869 RepID=A0A429ZXL0_9ENTE|nr:phosphomannomutase/phosphoglucomutase [Vagococcus vulneris]RST98608.1 phosphomannomutase/phosphoglucomutase [Vagococcus vulneris]
MSLNQLINGSDIRGVAIETAEYEATLTKENVKQIASGIYNWLCKKKTVENSTLKVAIGHDSRLSAAVIKDTLIENLSAVGVIIYDTGLSTTPAMFMATQYDDFNVDAGIMITASHLPYYYNGIKLFSKSGGAEHEDIEFILTHTDQSLVGGDKGQVIKKAILPEYSADLVSRIRKDTGLDKPLEGFHIVLDAGNGAGGFFDEHVLQPLGAITTGSQFLNPDGNFPNHMPNPDNKEAMASIREAVLNNQADLGIIFDTDVDRAAVVDETGMIINRNNLIAVLAKIVLTDHSGQTIVTNSPTSSHLKDFIEELGGKQVRYLCGYRNVINKAIELNSAGIDTPLAIETSGHAAFKENFFLDDGAYVIAKILMLLPRLKEQNQSLSSLIAELIQPIEAVECRMKINTKNDRKTGQKVINDLEVFVEQTEGFSVDQDNEEGIRVNVNHQYGDGWFLLRLSLHEPLLVLQVENDIAGKNELVLEKLLEFFRHYLELDIQNLRQLINK